MPNRYLPAALSDMVAEVHDSLLTSPRKDADAGDDEYVPEYEALVEMLQPQYREEFRRRRGEDVDG